MWVESTETDFGDGLVSSVTIAGTGAAAYVRISTAQATGGTITYSGGYTIHTFINSGTFTVPAGLTSVEYLVVAGGGGGGNNHAGGGGAGGLLTGTLAVTAGDKTVTVGAGGTSPASMTNPSTDGGNSVFSTIIAIGGGGGGNRNDNANNTPGRTGGSGGGGGGAQDSYPSNRVAGTGTAGQGNVGGTAIDLRGGGGGGAAGAGSNGTGPNAESGDGGPGLPSSISGTATYYAGGGGGSTGDASWIGDGGIGGGGNGGGGVGSNGTVGTANTGGGGGGGGAGVTQGSSGGSGIVIVRYSSSSYHPTGTYKSNVLDSGAKVVVSSVGWTPSSQPGGTSVIVGVRASSASFTAGSSWPDWVSVINGGSPAITGRYIQYMSTYTTTVSTVTPRIEEITVYYAKAKPWQEKSVVRTGANSYGIYGAENFEWEIPAKSGQLITVTAYIRYNANYGAASKPKITLYNLGVNSNATMSASADTWEQLQVSGTPNRNGVLKLKTEGFSTSPGAKMYVDDIQISQ